MKPTIGMNVKQLKELLASVPDEADEAVVVVPAQDHEFRQLRVCSVRLTTALFQGSVINTDYSEEITPESEYGERRTVLLVQ